MAEVLDEFDDATPVKSLYCKQLTSEEYEEEGCRLWGAVCLKTTKIELFINIDDIY